MHIPFFNEWLCHDKNVSFSSPPLAVADVEYKLIRGYGVTDAAVHDVNLLEDVVRMRLRIPMNYTTATPVMLVRSVRNGCVSEVTTRKSASGFRKVDRF